MLFIFIFFLSSFFLFFLFMDKILMNNNLSILLIHRQSNLCCSNVIIWRNFLWTYHLRFFYFTFWEKLFHFWFQLLWIQQSLFAILILIKMIDQSCFVFILYLANCTTVRMNVKNVMIKCILCFCIFWFGAKRTHKIVLIYF